MVVTNLRGPDAYDHLSQLSPGHFNEVLRAVGGDEADAGTAVEQVGRVVSPLVGDAEESSARSRGTPSATGASSSCRRVRCLAGGGEDQVGIGAVAAYQAGRRLQRGEHGAGCGADQGQVAGEARVGGEPLAATAASTASSAIRRYVVSLPPTTVITPARDVRTACRRDMSEVAPVRPGVEQRPQTGERPDHVGAPERPLEGGRRPRRAGTRSRRSAQGMSGMAPRRARR